MHVNFCIQQKQLLTRVTYEEFDEQSWCIIIEMFLYAHTLKKDCGGYFFWVVVISNVLHLLFQLVWLGYILKPSSAQILMENDIFENDFFDTESKVLFLLLTVESAYMKFTVLCNFKFYTTHFYIVLSLRKRRTFTVAWKL